jgi:type II secretory pathway component PulM
MNNIMAIVSDFLAGLEAREKRALKIGALVLAVVFVIMLILPKWEFYSLVKSQRDTLKSDVIWLQQKRDIVAKLVNNCPSVRQQKQDFKADLSHLVSRNQLKLLSANEKENIISLSVSGSKSNQFLKLMHQIACRGYILGELAIETEVDDLSKITATFEVERVN